MSRTAIQGASAAIGVALLLCTSPGAAQQPPPVATVPPPMPPRPPMPVESQVTPARPIGSPSAWINADDYQKDVWQAGIEGTVGFRLSIDRMGNVDGCQITSSSGYTVLDDTTCQLLTARAKFTPAQDATGRRLPGSYASRVRWVQPDEGDTMAMDRAPQQGQVVIEYVVGTDGNVRDCKVLSGADLYDLLSITTPCAWTMTYPPYRDAAGRPIVKRVRMTVTVSFPGPATIPAPRKRRGK